MVGFCFSPPPVTGYPRGALLQPSLHHLCTPAVLAGSDLPHVAGGPEDTNAVRPPEVEVGLPAGTTPVSAGRVNLCRGVCLTGRGGCNQELYLHYFINYVTLL